jgi:hypothetical protein
MGTLDQAVAQAVHAARLLERALHDPGPWSFDYSGQVFEAERIVHASHIHIRGTLPSQCWVTEPDGMLSLMVDGVVVAVRPLPHPGDGEHVIEWTLGVRESTLSA